MEFQISAIHLSRVLALARAVQQGGMAYFPGWPDRTSENPPTGTVLYVTDHHLVACIMEPCDRLIVHACVPCKKLKKLTMEQEGVAKVLEGMEVIYVDLDEHPSLAKSYRVTSVPDVFFIDAEGLIVDRLRKFEAAPAFLARLKKLSSAEAPKKEIERKPK